MSQETYQLSGNAAELYEELKVPAMFGPLADATLNAVPLAAGDAILDVACGTGIVARKARERAGPAARVVGADLNEGMIAMARSLADPQSRSCEWHVAGVGEMPFEDGAFDKIFCQQGFQFFPDEAAALREMRRVSRPGGVLAMTIWSGLNILFLVMADALAKFVDAETAERLGLLNRVYPHETFGEQWRAFARRLADGPSDTLAQIKRGVRIGADGSLDDALAHEYEAQSAIFLGDDAREGMRAFLEKRPPRFS